MKKSKVITTKVVVNGKTIKVGYYTSIYDIIRYNSEYTDNQIFVKVYGGNYEPLWRFTTYYI